AGEGTFVARRIPRAAPDHRGPPRPSNHGTGELGGHRMSTETRDEQTTDPDKETPVTDKPQGENQDETPEPEAEKGKQTEPEQPDEQTDETPEPAEDGKAGREAAKYRRKAREAEAERDAL